MTDENPNKIQKSMKQTKSTFIQVMWSAVKRCLALKKLVSNLEPHKVNLARLESQSQELLFTKIQ